ncbi:MAG: three-Cys-motif partner protein TcmP [Melioribacteraceae bacterium]
MKNLKYRTGKQMNEVNEPKNSWGGNWTEIKLETFEKYVNAYLTIMNMQKLRYEGWPTTIYFDGFAGSGSRCLTATNEENNLFADYLIKEELEVYKGSAERVLGLAKKFDYYYFVENVESSINSLEKMLREKEIANDKCYFLKDDVNNQLKELSNFIDDKKAALVLLDPFGMQIDWTSIELLKDKRVDLWILIPSGVIINRFLDGKGKLIFSKKLQSYFGLSEEEIRNKFYNNKSIETLFGAVDKVTKVNDSVAKIAELYIERLRKIWGFVSEEPLKLFNTKNVPIYHFVFASNNKTALKIAKQIIKKKNK